MKDLLLTIAKGLVEEQSEYLLADDLGDDDLFGLIGDRVVIKEMAALDTVLFELV